MDNLQKKKILKKKIDKVLLNKNNTDYDRYLGIRKIRNLENKYYSKKKTLEIIYVWLMNDAEYKEEKDKYNGHNWRIEYEKRYEKLIRKINN